MEIARGRNGTMTHSRTILLDTGKDGRTMAALLVDGRLEDLSIDPKSGDTTPCPGDIYWAKVDRPIPKLNAAFVKLGPDAQGYLRDAKGLRAGESGLVQVVSYPEPGKASPVTRRVLYKGRYVILTPGAPGVNISRQIQDEAARARLSETVSALLQGHDTGEQAGVILRTAAVGATDKDLAADLNSVFALRQTAEQDDAAGRNAPGLRAALSTARATALREWDGTVEDRPGCFERAEVWDKVEDLKSPRVDLPSGAWMQIETTAALVAVDVNTGAQFSGGAALTANLEAARELPRQLRLRGLGGIATVDFAPVAKKERRRIEDALKTAFRRDPVETSLAGWTPLGLFELQRKRERRPLNELL